MKKVEVVKHYEEQRAFCSERSVICFTVIMRQLNREMLESKTHNSIKRNQTFKKIESTRICYRKSETNLQ